MNRVVSHNVALVSQLTILIKMPHPDLAPEAKFGKNIFMPLWLKKSPKPFGAHLFQFSVIAKLVRNILSNWPADIAVFVIEIVPMQSIKISTVADTYDLGVCLLLKLKKDMPGWIYGPMIADFSPILGTCRKFLGEKYPISKETSSKIYSKTLTYMQTLRGRCEWKLGTLEWFLYLFQLVWSRSTVQNSRV